MECPRDTTKFIQIINKSEVYRSWSVLTIFISVIHVLGYNADSALHFLIESFNVRRLLMASLSKCETNIPHTTVFHINIIPENMYTSMKSIFLILITISAAGLLPLLLDRHVLLGVFLHNLWRKKKQTYFWYKRCWNNYALIFFF